MEVSGVEGTFRATCESVMNVLRDNKDILMAMLEAFVHDPLINWRLLSTTDDTDSENITTTTTGSSRTRSRPRSRSNPEVGVENAGVDDSDSDIRSSALIKWMVVEVYHLITYQIRPIEIERKENLLSSMPWKDLMRKGKRKWWHSMHVHLLLHSG